MNLANCWADSGRYLNCIFVKKSRYSILRSLLILRNGLSGHISGYPLNVAKIATPLAMYWSVPCGLCQFCCGVACSVYLTLTSSFQSLDFIHCSSALFSPALSIRSILTGLPCAFCCCSRMHNGLIILSFVL